MKTLVAYYSKTGNTRRLAEEIAKQLECDIDEIRDKRDWSGLSGWFSSRRSAYRKFMTEIEFKTDPAEYDLVVIGSPIWSNNVSPAVRTYFTRNITKFNNVAFFLTGKGMGIRKTFNNMEMLSKKPLATFEIHGPRIMSRIDKKKNIWRIQEFCEQLR